jgi:ferritin-like metal-binding protein YciE
MAIENLHDLFVDKLKDLYSAENQIIKALPRMIKGATSMELQQALQEHLNVTEEQARRVERVARDLGESPRGKKCAGMEGLLEEGKELFKEKIDPEVLDAGIIAAAQSVEHYEIAGYGTAIAWAKMLGHMKAAQALLQSLEEEKEADESLSMLAKNMINEMAAEEDDMSHNNKRTAATSTWNR